MVSINEELRAAKAASANARANEEAKAAIDAWIRELEAARA
jgi:hypothetical protein